MPFWRNFLQFLSSPALLGIIITLMFAWLAFDFYEARHSSDPSVHSASQPVQSLLREIHQKSIDWRLRARGPRPGSDDVVILTIDEKAIEQEGRWPWPRTKIREVIDRLMTYQPKVLGFDIVFADPVRNEGILALEELRRRYSGSSEFNQLLEEEMNRLQGARSLGEAVSEHSEKLVLGNYFEQPPIPRPREGYQNLCLQVLFQESSAFETWENRNVVLITADETAIDAPTEVPEALSEELAAHFTELQSREREKYQQERASKGLSPEVNKTGEVELQNRISLAQWNYCMRWLNLKEDENLEAYRRIWPEVQEEDESLASLAFEDGLQLFKDRQLHDSVGMTGRWWLNLPEIAEDAEHSAYFNAFLDDDGTVRKSNLVARAGNVLFPSLALRTYLVATGQIAQVNIEKNVKDDSESKAISSLQLLDEDGEFTSSIPVDGKGRLKINYAGPQKMFAHLSAAELLNDDPTLSVTIYRPDENGLWRERTLEHSKEDFIRDKIFVWGATATAIYDLRVTPFEENYPGVETHTNLVDNLLRQDFLRFHPYEEATMLVVLLVLGFVLSFFIGRSEAIAGLLSVFGLLISILLVDHFFLFGRGYVIATVFPLGLTFGLYFTLTAFKYFTEERKKKELKGTFGKYVSPAIVDEILSDPEKIELGGRKEHMSVFFSDIRGFTSISEELDAKTLSDLLNSYLTPMTEIVFENKGTLDKYMGDAIMAFFGAPIRNANHAEHACRAALQNIDRLKLLQSEYQKKNLPVIDIGIGINTGEMSVGNMGSETVRNYTVMGDAVNLGSRLEGINKQYGTRIIISESTQSELSKDFITREIDWVRVKGKAQPVRIFELIAEHQVPTEFTENLKWFDQGFEAYHRQNWQEALNSFSSALKAKPDDQVSQLYLQRCNDYLVSPPPAGWDGVFVMTTK